MNSMERVERAISDLERSVSVAAASSESLARSIGLLKSGCAVATAWIEHMSRGMKHDA